MYCRYVYTAGADATDILADIVALLTGATDKNLLSASCDKAATELVTTVAAGWTLHDAAAGPTAKAIKAPLADVPSAYKYVVVELAGGRIYFANYEAWNETTHVGTNPAHDTYWYAWQQQYDLTAGGEVILAASERFLLGQSNIPAGVGAPSGPTIVAEHERASFWDTVANGYPNVVWVSAGRHAGKCRFKLSGGGDTTNTTAYFNIIGNHQSPGYCHDTDLITLRVPLLPLYVWDHGRGLLASEVSNYCGGHFYRSTENFGVYGDELVTDAGTFVVLPDGDRDMRLVVKKA